MEEWRAEPRAPQAPAAWDQNEALRSTRKRTSLGLLKVANHRHFAFFESRHLVFIRTCLTTHWHENQADYTEAPALLWCEVFTAVELDEIAQVSLKLLAHHGKPGRAAANHIMWKILANLATDPDYYDISHKVVRMVKDARKDIDRPPQFASEDLEVWRWSCYTRVRQMDTNFSPDAAPTSERIVALRQPIAYDLSRPPAQPPRCWGPEWLEILEQQGVEYE